MWILSINKSPPHPKPPLHLSGSKICAGQLLSGMTLHLVAPSLYGCHLHTETSPPLNTVATPLPPNGKSTPGSRLLFKKVCPDCSFEVEQHLEVVCFHTLLSFGVQSYTISERPCLCKTCQNIYVFPRLTKMRTDCPIFNKCSSTSEASRARVPVTKRGNQGNT